MRFMILVKANKDSEAGVLPDEKGLTEMGKFNEQLAKAGVMLAGEGLQASSKGARVKFTGGKPTSVIDGPFAETKELVAGFWLWEVKSKEEAIEWLKRAPFDQETEVDGGHLSLPQLQDCQHGRDKRNQDTHKRQRFARRLRHPGEQTTLHHFSQSHAKFYHRRSQHNY